MNYDAIRCAFLFIVVELHGSVCFYLRLYCASSSPSSVSSGSLAGVLTSHGWIVESSVVISSPFCSWHKKR